MSKEQWYYRWAPSLGGGFDGTPEEAWGVLPYDPEKHINEPTVFCGLYGLPDFYALWRHKGKKAVWWAGSDIRHFLNGYWLDENGTLNLNSIPLAQWIEQHAESHVENAAECRALLQLGINSFTTPSFLGDVNKYDVCFRPSGFASVYISVSGNDFDLYDWPLINDIADKAPRVVFYLYGNTRPWASRHSNVCVRGRIPIEEMNAEIKLMQAGLRMVKFEGASEIVVKSALWGQHTISRIPYPGVDSYETTDQLIQLLNELPSKTKPNLDARKWFLDNVNKYPWNMKI